jgi:hypothetical protein
MPKVKPRLLKYQSPLREKGIVRILNLREPRPQPTQIKVDWFKVRLIEEMERNLMRDIQQEQDDRTQNEESFMDLIEQTCARIERNIN